MRALVPVLLATLLAACQMGSGSVEQRLAGEKPGAPATETPATMTLASGVELFVAEDFSRSRNPRVVVLPFADQRGLDDAIERRRAEYQVTQAFRNRFTGLKYAIVDPADAADALRAAGLDPYRPVPAGRRGEIAAALKADAVLVGDITHFDKLHAGIAGRIAVGAEVRLIDPARDRVLWRARHEARQTVGKVPTSLMDALATALNLAVDLDDKARAALLEEMLADLIEALPRPGTASAAPAAPSLRILSARHSAGERVLKIGDELKFAAVLSGEAAVTARIGALQASLRKSAQESVEGKLFYEGAYRIKAGDAILGQEVVFEARPAGGGEATRYVDAVAPVTFDTDPPAAPTDLAVEQVESRLKLAWTPVPAVDLAGYDIERSATPLSGFVKIGASETPAFIDATPLAGLAHYRVIARDKAGNVSLPAGPTEGRLVPAGPTPVNGDIAEDTVWHARGSPYVLSGQVVVPMGLTLRIEPGTVIEARPGAMVFARGRVLAEGRANAAIVWTGEPAARWKGIRLRDSQPGRESIFLHNRVVGAEIGLDIDGASPRVGSVLFNRNAVALAVANPASAPHIDNNTFRANGTGIALREVDIELTGNRFQGHSVAAIEATAAAPRIVGNAFTEGETAIHAKEQGKSAIIDAALNWWGTTERAAIVSAIKGSAALSPILDAPPPGGKAIALEKPPAPPAPRPAPPPAPMAGADVLATLQAAQRAAEEGQVEAAIAGFEAIAPAATTNAALHYQLALLHFRAGDATKAREAVDRALRIAPDVPSFHVTRARILKDLGDESGAEAALRRALQLKPGLGRTVGEGRS